MQWTLCSIGGWGLLASPDAFLRMLAKAFISWH
jgi:hypothetical protein